MHRSSKRRARCRRGRGHGRKSVLWRHEWRTTRHARRSFRTDRHAIPHGGGRHRTRCGRSVHTRWDRRARAGELALDVEAAHPGEPEVEHEAARPGFPLAGQELRRRGEHLGPEADGPEEFSDRDAHIGVVIDDEDGGRRPGWLMPATATASSIAETLDWRNAPGATRRLPGVPRRTACPHAGTPRAPP
jgi:hypothetical protein